MQGINRAINSKMAWLGFLSLLVCLSVAGLQSTSMELQPGFLRCLTRSLAAIFSSHIPAAAKVLDIVTPVREQSSVSDCITWQPALSVKRVQIDGFWCLPDFESSVSILQALSGGGITSCPTPDGNLDYRNVLESSDKVSSIRGLQLGSGLSVCPSGMSVLYLSTLCDNVILGKKSLHAAMNFLVAPPLSENPQDTSSIQSESVGDAKPTLLWKATFIQELGKVKMLPQRFSFLYCVLQFASQLLKYDEFWCLAARQTGIWITGIS
ncbi:hypothetical protein C5167_031226 [Papaver somniferum]|nr:hypothetical protein C5167_031226 [Papaver somniferum]